MRIFEMLAHGLGLQDDFFTRSFEEKESTMIQAWTDGRLKSVVLRAVVNKEKQRLSAAYFLSPTSSAIIECAPQLIHPNSNPRKYIPFTWRFQEGTSSSKEGVGKNCPQ
ncbi:gibberellin 20 oxidase 1 [Fagus crenata]